MASPAIVSGSPTTIHVATSTTPSTTYTPSAAGNRLIVCVNFSISRTINSTPTQLTAYGTEPTGVGWIGWMVTADTSIQTFSWTLSGSAAANIAIYEISGADTNGNNDVYSFNSHNGGGTTSFSTSGTATADNQLPISFNATITNVTVSSNNFTQDAYQTGGPYQVDSHSSLTTNGQVVTQTVQWSGSTFGAFNALILVNPGASSGLTVTPNTMTFTDPKSAAQTATISGGSP